MKATIKKEREDRIDKFLHSGGVLLKRFMAKSNEPIILHKKYGTKWTTRLTFTTVELRDKTFNFLTRKDKFFKSDEQ